MNEVWDGDRWDFRSRVHFEDFKGLCSWIYENGKPLDLFAIQVWSIWNQRNKLRLNHTCCLTKDLQKMAEESWNEIKRSNLRFSRINLSSTPQTKWTAPTPDSYKIKLRWSTFKCRQQIWDWCCCTGLSWGCYCFTCTAAGPGLPARGSLGIGSI